MRGPKRGTCTYCGSFEDMHEDDVPPKNIFQHRQNLIKVPSCYACNNPASKDDEYFMLYLALREDAKQKKEHAWLWAKAQRALRDEKAHGLNRRLSVEAQVGSADHASRDYTSSSTWHPY